MTVPTLFDATLGLSWFCSSQLSTPFGCCSSCPHAELCFKTSGAGASAWVWLGQLRETRQNPGEGNGIPLQYSCLENPMDGGAWWAAVHGVAKSRTRLRNFPITFHFPALEKEMATHSSVLAWRVPGTGEPGGLPSLGSHRVGHD